MKMTVRYDGVLAVMPEDFRAAGVYLITCLATGHQYVGASQRLQARIIGHISAIKASRHLGADAQWLRDQARLDGAA